MTARAVAPFASSVLLFHRTNSRMENVRSGATRAAAGDRPLSDAFAERVSPVAARSRHSGNALFDALTSESAEQRRKQQKKSQNQRNEKKRSAGKERSAKITCKMDFWSKAESLFGRFPSNSEIDNAFSKVGEVDALRERLNSRSEPTAHWSVRFKSYMRNRPKMLKLPHQQNPYCDREEFWSKSSHRFQIEECQKRKLSTLHHLLNSFVIVSADDVVEKPKETNNFALFPYPLIVEARQSSSYISLTFEERLEFELQSLGLSKRDEGKKVGPFDGEMKYRMNQIITEIVPKLTMFQKEIKDNADKFRSDIQKRNSQIRSSLSLSNIVKQSNYQ